MEENTVEMCAFDTAIPKYYKGHDMDLLLQKMIDGKPLTPEEEQVLLEAQSICRKEKFEENRKQWEAYKKAHPGVYIRNICPQRTDK